MPEKAVLRSLELGILAESDAHKIDRSQVWALKFMNAVMENEGLHDHGADSGDICLMSEEIDKLNDMVDLEECDLVFPSKSFRREEEVEVSIPSSLAPFMTKVVLPMIRKIVERGP